MRTDIGATYPAQPLDLFHGSASELIRELQAAATNDSDARDWLYVPSHYIRDNQAGTYIGQIVGRNTYLIMLSIKGRYNRFDRLCNGLGDNRTIK